MTRRVFAYASVRGAVATTLIYIYLRKGLFCTRISPINRLGSDGINRQLLVFFFSPTRLNKTCFVPSHPPNLNCSIVFSDGGAKTSQYLLVMRQWAAKIVRRHMLWNIRCRFHHQPSDGGLTVRSDSIIRRRHHGL